MQQYNAVIFSFDMLLSIPIAIFAVLLLITSYSTSTSTITKIYGSDYGILHAGTTSQEMISEANGNFTAAAKGNMNGIAEIYPVNSAFDMSCGISYLCRIVTINGKQYLMVFSYESTNSS